MKRLSFALSMIAFMLYSLVDFAKYALETYFRVQLLNGAGSFSSADHAVNAQQCQMVLLVVAFVCLGVFVVSLKSEKQYP